VEVGNDQLVMAIGKVDKIVRLAAKLPGENRYKSDEKRSGHQ